ncbi:ComF family protein [Evansella cellulosilytica]|uniref:Phosphoribosyltransferase n=1 Tax=Evansella cellulosilytica (strain ATCC 21833 / DSM 2522 / FERM P-1141 / JCM 9156 / N-4) TaxID=649639 RepID=E6TSA1_EVAC2|nr:ComF family protein [Evansella cellulosilytica]ADU31870.1 phosphoribosyltransferase [Evansella cellulosilytica DSM 2522]
MRSIDINGDERCLWCHEKYSSKLSWNWFVGFETYRKLCGECNEQLGQIHDVDCHVCGWPAEKSKGKASLCGDCERWKETKPWDELPFVHRSLYVYNPFLQELLARYKYRGDVALHQIFSHHLKKLAGRIGDFDIATYIPLSEKRKWERGFNQAEVLGAAFSNKLSLLEKVSKRDVGEKQSKRSRAERLRSLDGAFTLSKDGQGLTIANKKILLVDDIYTTGATLRSAATVLYRAGAKSVGAVTVARSVAGLVE